MKKKSTIFTVMIDGVLSIVELYKPMSRLEMLRELKVENVRDNIKDVYPV